MGYVSNNLMSGERVIHEGKVHWFVFVPSLVMFVVAFWLGMPTADESDSSVLGFLIFLTAIVSLLNAFIVKNTTELAITTKRVIAKVGLIGRKTVELNHSKVESFNIDQGIFGRIFGFGTVVVCGTGGGKTPIRAIVAPLEFRRQAMSIVDEAGTTHSRTES